MLPRIKSVYANKYEQPLEHQLLLITYGSAFNGNKRLYPNMPKLTRMLDKYINPAISRTNKFYYNWIVRILAVQYEWDFMVRRLQQDDACDTSTTLLSRMCSCPPYGVQLYNAKDLKRCHQSLLCPGDHYYRLRKVGRKLWPYAVPGNVFASTLIYPQQREAYPNQPCIDHINEAVDRLREDALWTCDVMVPVIRPGFHKNGVALAMRVFVVTQEGVPLSDLSKAKTHKHNPRWTLYPPTLKGLVSMVGNPEHNYPAYLLYHDTPVELLTRVLEIQSSIRQHSHGFSQSITQFGKMEICNEWNGDSRRLTFEAANLEQPPGNKKRRGRGTRTDRNVLPTDATSVGASRRRLRLQPTDSDGRPSI